MMILQNWLRVDLIREYRRLSMPFRVIGNNAVHPGHIDLKDDRETGETLFHLINAITDKMISNPKMIDKIYENLPEDVRNKIAKRNSKV